MPRSIRFWVLNDEGSVTAPLVGAGIPSTAAPPGGGAAPAAPDPRLARLQAYQADPRLLTLDSLARAEVDTADFSGVQSGSGSTAPGPPRNVFGRAADQLRALGHALVTDPVRTVGSLAVAPLQSLGRALTPEAGEPAPLAAKIGYGPAVGLPAPGTPLTRATYTGPLVTPAERAAGLRETVANLLLAPAAGVMGGLVGRLLGPLGGAVAGGAAAGGVSSASYDPNDPAAAGLAGAVAGGVLGGAGHLVTAPFRGTVADLAPPPPPRPAPRATAVPVSPRALGLASTAPDLASPEMASLDLAGPRATAPLASPEATLPVALSAATPGIRGNADVATLPDGSTHPVHYEVVEASQLTPSTQMAEPLRLPIPTADRSGSGVPAGPTPGTPTPAPPVPVASPAPVPAAGLPIVTPDGLVVAGDQRIASPLPPAIQPPEGMAADRAVLVQRARSLGIDPAAIDGMTAPVLVRRLDPFPEPGLAGPPEGLPQPGPLPAPVPADAGTMGGSDDIRDVGAPAGGNRLLVGPRDRGGDLGAAPGAPGAGGGRGAAGLRGAAVGRAASPERVVGDRDAFATDVASRAADRRDPAQRDLFDLVHGAATDLAHVAEATPATPLRGFARRVPGLEGEPPFSRDALAALRREGRMAPLVGQTLPTLRDVAVAAQIYRDPRWETFRLIYMRGNRVVFVEALGARAASGERPAPSSGTVLIGGSPDRTWQHISDRARALSATGLYLQHNHPSGAPKPSPADLRVTRKFAEALARAGGPPVLGHIIIDDTEFGLLTADGQPSVHPLAMSERRPVRGATINRPAILSPADAVAVAQTTKMQQRAPDAILLLHVDAQGRVAATQDTPMGTITTPMFQEWARQVGAPTVVAVVQREAALTRLQVPSEHLTDVIVVHPSGVAYSMEDAGRDFGSDLFPETPSQVTEAFRVREPPPKAPPEPPRTAAGEAAYQQSADRIDYSGAIEREAGRAGAGLLSTKWERIADALANDRGPIERLGDLAAKADPDFPPTQNPAFLLAYEKEAASTVHRAVTEGVPDPISRDVIGPSYREVFAPFGRNDERIRRALTYAVEVRGVGRGVDAYGGDAAAFRTAQATVAYLGRDPANRAFVQRLTQFTDAIGNYAVRSGLWTPDLWAALQASDVLFVPYRRLLDGLARLATTQGARGARGLVNVTSGVEVFLGSRRALANPALALAEYTDAIIRRADAYRIGASLFDAADRMGDLGEAILTPVAETEISTRARRLQQLAAKVRAAASPELRPILDELDGLFQPAPDPQHPVIWRTRPDGTREYRIVNAPELYRAVAALRANQHVVFEVLDKVLLPLRRVFTVATTGWVPRFSAGTNLVRDFFDAMARTQHGMTPLDWGQGFVDALAHVVGLDHIQRYLPRLQRSLARILDPAGITLADLLPHPERAQRALQHGLGSVSMYGAATRPAQIARRFAPTTPAQRIAGRVGRYTLGDRSPLALVEHVFSASDMVPRLGEMYAALRNPAARDRVRRGVWTPADLELYAARYGRPITLDFSNRPGNPLLAVYARYAPFVNPSLQSPVRYVEAFQRNPRRVAAMMAAASAAAVLAWVLKHRSAAATASVNDRTDDERAGFLLMPMDDQGNVTLRMPLGQEAGIVTSATTAILDAWMDHAPHAASPFVESVLRALPPGFDQWVQGQPEVPIPLLQQMQENARNARYYGGAPVEPPGLQDRSPAERRLPTTPVTYSLLANLPLVRQSGLSPLQIRNLARGVLSQSEPLLTTGTDVLARAIMGSSAPVTVRPAVRSSPFNPLSVFLASNPPYGTASEQRYYAARTRYQQAEADFKAAEATADAGAVARLQQRGGLAVLDGPTRTAVEWADPQLQQLGAAGREIQLQARFGLPPDQVRQQLDRIQQMRQAIYREAMRIIEAQQGGSR